MGEMTAPSALDAKRKPVLGVETILRIETFHVKTIKQYLNYNMQDGSIFPSVTEICTSTRDRRSIQRTKKSKTHIHCKRGFHSLVYTHVPSDQRSNGTKGVESTHV